jgi:hypothetical protein
VAVADLHEAKFAGGSRGIYFGRTTEAERFQYAALHHAQRSGAGPGHALQKATAVDAIVVVVD